MILAERVNAARRQRRRARLRAVSRRAGLRAGGREVRRRAEQVVVAPKISDREAELTHH